LALVAVGFALPVDSDLDSEWSPSKLTIAKNMRQAKTGSVG